MINVKCPRCGYDYSIRATTLGGPWRCRTRGCKGVYVWTIQEVAKPEYNHWPHLTAIMLTCGLWVPFYLGSLLYYHGRACDTELVYTELLSL